MLSQRTQRGHWQEQKSADDHDGAQQEKPERWRVVAQGTERERRRCLSPQAGRHRDRRDDRQEAADDDDNRGCNIPLRSRGRRIRIVIEAIGRSETVESRSIVR